MEFAFEFETNGEICAEVKFEAKGEVEGEVKALVEVRRGGRGGVRHGFTGLAPVDAPYSIPPEWERDDEDADAEEVTERRVCVEARRGGCVGGGGFGDVAELKLTAPLVMETELKWPLELVMETALLVRVGDGAGAAEKEQYPCLRAWAAPDAEDEEVEVVSDEALYLFFGVLFSWSGRGRDSGEGAGVGRNGFGFEFEFVQVAVGTGAMKI